jgi:hypothetical protein
LDYNCTFSLQFEKNYLSIHLHRWGFCDKEGALLLLKLCNFYALYLATTIFHTFTLDVKEEANEYSGSTEKLSKGGGKEQLSIQSLQSHLNLLVNLIIEFHLPQEE